MGRQVIPLVRAQRTPWPLRRGSLPRLAYRAGETNAAVIAATLGTGWFRAERNHPAASQERGIENSENPQSRQT